MIFGENAKVCPPLYFYKATGMIIPLFWHKQKPNITTLLFKFSEITHRERKCKNGMFVLKFFSVFWVFELSMKLSKYAM